MTKPTVTDAMVADATLAFIRAGDDQNPIQSAIEAAIEASGLVEENARLRDMMQTARGLLIPDWRGYCDAAAAAEIIDRALQPTLFGFPIVIDPTVKGFEFRNKEPSK